MVTAAVAANFRRGVKGRCCSTDGAQIKTCGAPGGQRTHEGTVWDHGGREASVAAPGEIALLHISCGGWRPKHRATKIAGMVRNGETNDVWPLWWS